MPERSSLGPPPLLPQSRRLGVGELLMHYPIALPTDYDMGIIRNRVRIRGSALDDRDGLVFKAYCVSEVGVDGALSNAYSPFYLWHDASAAGEFLWSGQGFQAIVADFGRPVVRTWVPVAQSASALAPDRVTHAVLRERSLPAGADPALEAERLRSWVADRHREDDVHAATAGIDPQGWRSVEFATFVGRPETHAVDAQLFSVLHVSQPSQADS